MRTTSMSAVRAVIGLNLLLHAGQIGLFAAFVGLDECTFSLCWSIMDQLMPLVFILFQLMWLTTAWMARLLGRNGLEWLAYSALAMVFLLNLIVLALDSKNMGILALMFAAVPVIQFYWLLVLSWRDLAAIEASGHTK